MDIDLELFKEVYGNVTKYNGDSSTTFTPLSIAEEMVSLLPDSIWNPDTTFIDITCKTGAFLIATFNKLDYALSKIPEYSDSKVRRNHILNNQLYGLSLDDEDTLYYSRRNVYGDIMHSNIQYIGSVKHNYQSVVHSGRTKEIKGFIQEAFGNMKFNVVLGNPPYNRGGTSTL